MPGSLPARVSISNARPRVRFPMTLGQGLYEEHWEALLARLLLTASKWLGTQLQGPAVGLQWCLFNWWRKERLRALQEKERKEHAVNLCSHFSGAVLGCFLSLYNCPRFHRSQKNNCTDALQILWIAVLESGRWKPLHLICFRTSCLFTSACVGSLEAGHPWQVTGCAVTMNILSRSHARCLSCSQS